MAIGDPIEFRNRRTDTWVRRFDAPDGAKALETDLLGDAVFEADVPRAWLYKLWLAVTFRFRRGDRGLRLKLQKFGILALAERINDVFRVGAGPTGVGVEVPYPHLAMVAGFPLNRDPDDLASDLHDELDRRWQAYVDPIVGPRIALYRDSERTDGRLALFIGRGVFVPKKGEKPIGTVELASADGSSEWIEPRLPDGRPAGLYRGQSCLAFADRAERAPATCSLVDDAKHLYVLQLQRTTNWREERVSGAACLTAVSTAPLQASDTRPDPRGINPPEGYDAAFDVLRDGTPYLKVRVICDRRRSALRRGRPPLEREGLDVIGLLAPDRQSFGRQIDRFWIDLDADNLFAAAAFSSVEKSVIIKGRSVETYEWATNRFQIGSNPPFTFEESQIGGRDRTVVCRVDRRPLGTLLPPPVPRSIGFEGTRGDETYDLGWLDFTGAVEPVFGETVRLAEAFAKAAVDPSTLQIPSVDQVAAMKPGKEFFVGPLLVRVGERA